MFSGLDRIEQAFSHELAIHRLRTRILHRDANAARAVVQRDCGRDLVHVLAAGPAGTCKRFFQISLANAKALHSLLQSIHWLHHTAPEIAPKGHNQISLSAAKLELARFGGAGAPPRRTVVARPSSATQSNRLMIRRRNVFTPVSQCARHPDQFI